MAMTQRERYLAIGVGVVVGLFGVQYTVSSLRGHLDAKQQKIRAAESRSEELTRKTTDGMIAAKKISELTAKSLPTNREKLIVQYSDWLIKTGQAAGLESINVIPPPSGRPHLSNDAFSLFRFKFTGTCKTDEAIDFMAKFYDRDYLHSINALKLTPTRDENIFTMSFDAEAVALKDAAPEQEPSERTSGRLAASVDEYKAKILNRNPFSPPNRPPVMKGDSQLTIDRGDRWSHELAAEDPESHPFEFEVVDSELPDGLSLDGNRLNWRPEENGEFEVTVRVTDKGWPSLSNEQKLVLKVVDPKEPEVKVDPPKFDPASQAYVTALVSGRNGRQMFIHSRTENKMLKPFPGEDIEVGTIKAKVIDINVREGFAELETDGNRWTIGVDVPLTTAYEKSKVD